MVQIITLMIQMMKQMINFMRIMLNRSIMSKRTMTIFTLKTIRQILKKQSILQLQTMKRVSWFFFIIYYYLLMLCSFSKLFFVWYRSFSLLLFFFLIYFTYQVSKFHFFTQILLFLFYDFSFFLIPQKTNVFTTKSAFENIYK